MEKLYANEIAAAVGGTLLQGDPGDCAVEVSTDTRSIGVGALFFALKGENADGHEYIGKAIEKGAAGVIVSDENAVPAGSNAFVVKVDDPLWAMGDLAAHYRNKFDVRVVGVTGSVGKTTTKDMLASILERKWKVLKNKANYNNEIGVPLTLFGLDPSHEVVVLEMGMRGLEEIRRLARISRPSVGIITNIGISHIERLGSQSAIADAKAELFEELGPEGIPVMNSEDGYFMVMNHRFGSRMMSFGSHPPADVVGTKIKTSSRGDCEFTLTSEDEAVDIKLPILGLHNVYNALAAATAAVAMGVDLQTIRDGLASFTPSAMRMELVEAKAGFCVLNDAYNASPASMLAALRTLNSLKGKKRKIAVLGDMLELGDYASKAHRDIGSALVGSGIEVLVTVGALALTIADGARAAGFPTEGILSYSSSLEAARELRTRVRKGDAVLVKGSRGIRMEEIVKELLVD